MKRPTEIDLDDLGIMRPVNMWQIARIKRIRGPNARIAWVAFGLGMTVRQFKKLTPEQQARAWAAHRVLTGPEA